MARRFPDQPELYARSGWAMPASIDRVYANVRAREELGWTPRFGFAQVLESLRTGRDWRSPLAHAIGIKGYHDKDVRAGRYPAD